MSHTLAAPLPLSADPPAVRIGPIIVAVDASEDSAVLHAARVLAPTSVGGMLVASVVEPLPAYFTGFEPVILPPGFETERAEARRAGLTEHVRELAGENPNWRTEITYGEPSIAIADLARAQNAPFIVMGLGRHRPIERLLGGETTLRTIRRATCPVLAVGSVFPAVLRHVVVATDFSPSSTKAAESVLPLLSSGTTLHLVHVWQPHQPTDARLSLVDQSYLLSLHDKFRRFRAMISIPQGIVVKEEVREGKASERVLDYAATHSADLVVAGRHGMNLLARLMVGSVSTALLRGATCSVLIASEPNFADLDRFARLFAGASESSKPVEWAVQLDNFSRRNRGRSTMVEVDDYVLGAHVMETGYALQGVVYDPHDRRVELMLGDPKNRSRHVTRAIANVESITITADTHGRDIGLRLNHAPGQTVLTFSRVAG